MKPARVGREKPWHQDSVSWPWVPMELVSAMTALDEAGPENGCLQVIPRTHLDQRQHYGSELQIDLDEAEQARTRYVPLAAGDTLLFHSLILHASEPNHSGRDRRVCIYSYKSPELDFIGKGDRPEPILVSEITDPRVADF
jgi:ectoine hydroxylase-related dioxygenase (phytanoyl-CoA dioxygenase family)